MIDKEEEEKKKKEKKKKTTERSEKEKELPAYFLKPVSYTHLTLPTNHRV